MAFMAPVISLVAELVRSVGVASGAARLWRSSSVFVEPFLCILFSLCGVDCVSSRCQRASPSAITRPQDSLVLPTRGCPLPHSRYRPCFRAARRARVEGASVRSVAILKEDAAEVIVFPRSRDAIAGV